jgi:hypothetical protein
VCGGRCRHGLRAGRNACSPAQRAAGVVRQYSRSPQQRGQPGHGCSRREARAAPRRAGRPAPNAMCMVPPAAQQPWAVRASCMRCSVLCGKGATWRSSGPGYLRAWGPCPEHMHTCSAVLAPGMGKPARARQCHSWGGHQCVIGGVGLACWSQGWARVMMLAPAGACGIFAAAARAAAGCSSTGASPHAAVQNKVASCASFGSMLKRCCRSAA